MRDLAHVLFLLADHDALNAAFRLDAGIDQVVGLDATELSDARKALFVDRFDHKTELIHVCGQNNALSVSLLVRNEVAEAVYPHFVHMIPDLILNVLRNLGFTAGRSVYFTNLFCQLAVEFHIKISLVNVKFMGEGAPLPPINSGNGCMMAYDYLPSEA